MINRKIIAYVHQDDLNDHKLEKLRNEKGKMDVWLINPGSNYSEVNLEFQQPDIIHHVTDTQIDKLIKLLGFSPESGQGKLARQEIFGSTEPLTIENDEVQQ